MPMPATIEPQPLILVRGFGGLDVSDERRIAYQGFNDGTVYPQKRGENYIYEGMILRFMKSNWRYHDATNVIGYYGSEQSVPPEIPRRVDHPDLTPFFGGDRVVMDPYMADRLLDSSDDFRKTLWVFRYYDLTSRSFDVYGPALERLIRAIRALSRFHKSHPAGAPAPRVNIIAHSMGGLLVREVIQRRFRGESEDYINKVVTLGTPHRGISFQFVKNFWPMGAEKELEHFNPDYQKDGTKDESYKNFHKSFPTDRLLCVVGTNYRTYDSKVASIGNRLFPMDDDGGIAYNRSDGLVKQISAQIPNAPRTFVHKCHGGVDSLVTSREGFEAARRFFFGNLKARLRLVKAKILRGQDLFGKSEFFLGVSIKPRGVDFDLFHQSAEAENCYGPFTSAKLDDAPQFGWANDEQGLIWEGWLDTTAIATPAEAKDADDAPKDIAMRLDFYVGERDKFGIGFSDNVIFRKQYYVRAVVPGDIRAINKAMLDKARLELHVSEKFVSDDKKLQDQGRALDGFMVMKRSGGEWVFNVRGTGFDADFAIGLQPS